MQGTKKEVLSDYVCSVCMEIFLEPVTLPCNHTFCYTCFEYTLEKTTLCCPLCRHRFSSWARHHSTRNTRINQDLWKRIQQEYPEQCRCRTSSLDVELEVSPSFLSTPVLSSPGEIKAEYDTLIAQIEAERQALQEEEWKASERYIQKLLAEEEQEHRRREEKRKAEEAEQLKKDEELACAIYSEMVNLNDSKGWNVLWTVEMKHYAEESTDIAAMQSTSGAVHRKKSCKKRKYSEMLAPDENQSSHVKKIKILGHEEEQSMNSPNPSFNYLELEELYQKNVTMQESADRELAMKPFKQEPISPPSAGFNHMVLQNLHQMYRQESADREFAMKLLEEESANSPGTSFNPKVLESLHEKYQQESADQKLAKKLQKQLNRERRVVCRQKGTPNEYRFRSVTLARSVQNLQSNENMVPNNL